MPGPSPPLWAPKRLAPPSRPRCSSRFPQSIRSHAHHCSCLTRCSGKIVQHTHQRQETLRVRNRVPAETKDYIKPRRLWQLIGSLAETVSVSCSWTRDPSNQNSMALCAWSGCLSWSLQIWIQTLLLRARISLTNNCYIANATQSAVPRAA